MHVFLAPFDAFDLLHSIARISGVSEREKATEVGIHAD